MKLEKEFLDLIQVNGTLTQKQFDILEIKNENKENWINFSLDKDISKNNKNLLILLKGINNEDIQEQIIKNYHLVLKYNNINAKVYETKKNEPEIEEQNDILSIYCDGACSGNPGFAGSGVAIYTNSKPILLYGDFVEVGTNNIAELNALFKALQIVENSNTNKTITIFSDSKYAIESISTWAYSWKKNGWSKKGGEIKNLDLIIKSHELYEKLKTRVNLEHVKGHSGIIGNELADRMALNAISLKSVDYQIYNYEKIEDVLRLKAY